MLLNIENLVVSMAPIRRLQGVSLSIAQGEMVALIGGNGAGKTTLLRTISGLLRPAAGRFNSMRPRRLNYNNSRRMKSCAGISHAPGGRQVFANLTVRENLRLGAYQRNGREQIEHDLNRCFSLFPILLERQHQKAGTLSGGEQQMLAIGRALMAHPVLLLLDEPSLGLAPLVVRKIFEIIRTINAEGTTIFLVEQNAHMALNVAHRGYVLQSGASSSPTKPLPFWKIRK